ncbi:hypothetical protein M434DRAFT_172202 [Hypoxylon sp. CO27-5]|nr:hypothetical protein M434DRAFT_172202 [Hypoxylon sp. CO27-5]
MRLETCHPSFIKSKQSTDEINPSSIGSAVSTKLPPSLPLPLPPPLPPPSSPSTSQEPRCYFLLPNISHLVICCVLLKK